MKLYTNFLLISLILVLPTTTIPYKLYPSKVPQNNALQTLSIPEDLQQLLQKNTSKEHKYSLSGQIPENEKVIGQENRKQPNWPISNRDPDLKYNQWRRIMEKLGKQPGNEVIYKSKNWTRPSSRIPEREINFGSKDLTGHLYPILEREKSNDLSQSLRKTNVSGRQQSIIPGQHRLMPEQHYEMTMPLILPGELNTKSYQKNSSMRNSDFRQHSSRTLQTYSRSRQHDVQFMHQKLGQRNPTKGRVYAVEQKIARNGNPKTNCGCNPVNFFECGIDGKSYQNSCFRICAGVPFKKAGYC